MAKKKVKLKKKLAHSQKYTLLSFEKRRHLEGFMFSIPWLIGFICFIIIPLVLSGSYKLFKVTLTDLYGFAGESKWIGINNYVEIIKDPTVGQTVFESFGNSLVKVPIIVAFALLWLCF